VPPPNFTVDGWAAVVRAGELARTGGVLAPAHLLVAITQTASFAAPALSGDVLDERGPAGGNSAHGGVVSDLLTGQAIGTANDFARRRRQPTAAAHLLVALVDQGSDSVTTVLQRAKRDPAVRRAASLASLGYLSTEPRLPLAPLPAAGTNGRQPLPLAELSSQAWAQLVSRQGRLPLSRLHTTVDWLAINLNEQRAVLRLADQLRLDDDQRYSLLHRHLDEAQRRGAIAAPSVVRPPRSEPAPILVKGGSVPGRRRRGPVPIGWRAWLGNRKVHARAAWLRWTHQQ
jgi:hypothetical protein